MTSEEGKEDSAEESSTTLCRKNGNQPMTHVSSDALKEFMCSGPSEDNKSGSESDLADFDLPDYEPPSSKKGSSGSSVSVPEVNGISSPPLKENKDEDKKSPKPNISDDTDFTGFSKTSSSNESAPKEKGGITDSETLPDEDDKESSMVKKSEATETEGVSKPAKESAAPETPKKDDVVSNESTSEDKDNTGVEKTKSTKPPDENSREENGISKSSEEENVISEKSEKEKSSANSKEENSTSAKLPEKQSTSENPSEEQSTSEKPSEEQSTSVESTAEQSTYAESTEESTCPKPTEEKSVSVKSPKRLSPKDSNEDQSEEDLDDIEDPQPGTPLSETLSQISLEETLLKDVDNDFNDDHEIDELSEEKLLQDTYGEKNESKSNEATEANNDNNSNSAHSLHLFDDISDGNSKLSQSTSNSSQGNKDIDKIIHDLDSSIKKSTKKLSLSKSNSNSSSSSQKASSKEDDKGSKKGSSSSSANSDASSDTSKSADESSKARDKSTKPGKQMSTHSLPLPDNSRSNSTSQKRSLPADFMDGVKDGSSLSKVMRKDSASEEQNDKMSESSPTAKDSPLTFREALKSIALEEKLKSIDKPQPLVPTTEISTSASESSSLTVLQSLGSSSSLSKASDSDTANQGTKRLLVLNGEMNGSKPNLKKIRVIKAPSNEIFKKGDVVRDVQSINLGLVEMSKKIENVKTMETRLQEEKALHQNKKNNEMSLPKESFVHIDKDELEKRTAQELRSMTLGNNKLKRIKRKDLESLVIELFVDKVLYEHQLGQQKDLCKRLEATLEANRKKAAQFHKEVDDLKKVTQRLQAEHAARKNQIMAPVRVKRSVGIQATPTIIGKGIMQATSNTNVRILTPSTKSSCSSSSTITTLDSFSDSSQVSQVSQTDPLTITTTPSPATTTNLNPPKNFNHSSAQTPAESVTSVQSLVKTPTPTATFATPCVVPASTVNLSTQSNPAPATQMVVVNPVMMQQQPQTGTVGSSILPAGTTRIVRAAPLTSINSSQASPLTATAISGTVSSPRPATSSNIIDLTDDDESSKGTRTAVPAGSVLAFQRPPGVSIGQNTSGQFVALNPPSSVGQFVLVPPSLGQPATALVVGSVASNTQTLTTVGTPVRSNVISATGPARFSSPTTIVRVNGGSFMAPINRHPAPLPRAPPQQTSGYSKKLPPVPMLKLSQKDNSIVLSWNMAKTDEHEGIASYQLYAYQEGTAPPTPNLWKKVGSVKALELPMACTLTQFMPGHVYHFAVRAVDIRSRLGPFSDPKSVRLGKQLAV